MRRAQLTTDHGDDTTAQRCARALAPDNTDELSSHAEESDVVTTIERTDTAGVHSTLEDYLRNLQLAARLADDSTPSDDRQDDSTPSDGGSEDPMPSDADRRRSTRTDGDADESTHDDTSSTRQTDTEHDTHE